MQRCYLMYVFVYTNEDEFSSIMPEVTAKLAFKIIDFFFKYQHLRHLL